MAIVNIGDEAQLALTFKLETLVMTDSSYDDVMQYLDTVKEMEGYSLNFKESFNQDISRWNTSNVIGMSDMFTGSKSLKQSVVV